MSAPWHERATDSGTPRGGRVPLAATMFGRETNMTLSLVASA
jgi:hypothetical protein